MVTVEVILCNRALGTQKEPTLYGTCHKKLNHPGGCSSELLRRFRRDATAKSRAKHRKVVAPAPIDDSILDDERSEPVAECDHTDCKYPCRFAGIPYPSAKQIAAEQERAAREAAAWEEEQRRLLAKPRKQEPPVDMQVWLRMAHPAMVEYRAQSKKWSTGLP